MAWQKDFQFQFFEFILGNRPASLEGVPTLKDEEYSENEDHVFASSSSDSLWIFREEWENLSQSTHRQAQNKDSLLNYVLKWFVPINNYYIFLL